MRKRYDTKGAQSIAEVDIDKAILSNQFSHKLKH